MRIIQIGPYTEGDRLDWPYFRIFKYVLNTTTKRVYETEVDLTNDYTVRKFYARKHDNTTDIGSHAGDDIDINLTIDAGGICHVEWGDGDLEVGRYRGKIYLEDSSNKGRHLPVVIEWEVEPKMRGTFGG